MPHDILTNKKSFFSVKFKTLLGIIDDSNCTIYSIMCEFKSSCLSILLVTYVLRYQPWAATLLSSQTRYEIHL